VRVKPDALVPRTIHWARAPWVAATILAMTMPATAHAYQMIGTEAEFVERAGFTDEAQVVWHRYTVHPRSPRSEFRASEEKLVYFIVFRNLKYLRSVNFKAEWYGPSGQVHSQTQFTQIPGDFRIAMVELAIRGTAVADLPGKWRLKVFEDNGELIADRAFIIQP
jgi:hypothetical protein